MVVLAAHQQWSDNVRISGTDIFITKGDTENLIISFGEDLKNNLFFMFCKGDRVVGAYDDPTDEVTFKLSDFNLDVGKYFYDIVMIEDGDTENDFPKTLIRKGTLTIEAEFPKGKPGAITEGENPQEGV